MNRIAHKHHHTDPKWATFGWAPQTSRRWMGGRQAARATRSEAAPLSNRFRYLLRRLGCHRRGPERAALDYRRQRVVVDLQRKVHATAPAARFVGAEDNLRNDQRIAYVQLAPAAFQQARHHISNRAVDEAGPVDAFAAGIRHVPRRLAGVAIPERRGVP